MTRAETIFCMGLTLLSGCDNLRVDPDWEAQAQHEPPAPLTVSLDAAQCRERIVDWAARREWTVLAAEPDSGVVALTKPDAHWAHAYTHLNVVLRPVGATTMATIREMLVTTKPPPNAFASTGAFATELSVALSDPDAVPPEHQPGTVSLVVPGAQ